MSLSKRRDKQDFDVNMAIMLKANEVAVGDCFHLVLSDPLALVEDVVREQDAIGRQWILQADRAGN